MKDTLNIIINQLDKLDSRLDSVDKTLVKQEENLKEHMRRTDLLEKQHNSMQKNIHEELEPIKNHVNQVKGISKFAVILIPIALLLIKAALNYYTK